MVIGRAADLLRVGIGFFATFLLIASPKLWGLPNLLRQQVGYVWWTWALLHGLAFAILFRLSAPVFGASVKVAEPSIPWLFGWMAAGGATFLFWLLAVAPAAAWRRSVGEQKINLLWSAICAVVAWIGGLLAQRFWKFLAELTLRLSRSLLSLIYPQLIYDPEQALIGTRAFVVEIAPECSGYEGIALITVFTGVYLWTFRKGLSFPKALLLFPIGIAAIWAANILRITALVVVGSSVSPEIAFGGFHSQAGWISFTVIALGLILVSHRLRFSVPATAQPQLTATEGTPAIALLAPLLALMAASMLSAMVSNGLDQLYPVGVIATAAVLWHFRASYRPLEWPWSWRPVAIGIGVFVFWILLEPANDDAGQRLFERLAEWPPWLATAWIFFRVLGSAVTVPAAEELAFRGYLIRKLVSKDFETVRPGHFTWFSFIVSSVLFGLLHGRLVAGTLAGVAFALALYRRGRIADAILAHMISNALIAFAVLVLGSRGLWVRM